MKKYFRIATRILLALIALIVLFILYKWIPFYIWKREIISNLPGPSNLIKTENGQIEYQVEGDSKDYILVFHGTPSSYQTEDYSKFIEQGFSIIRVSRPGYYRTPISMGETTLEQADMFAQLLDTLGIDSVYVSALSGGGPYALQFVIRNQEKCRALVLKSTITKQDKSVLSAQPKTLKERFYWTTDFGNWLNVKRQLEKVDNKYYVDQLWKFLETGRFPLSESRIGMKNDELQISKLPELQIDKIEIPTLIVHGDRDMNVHFSHAEYANKKIPNSQMMVLENEDHFFLFREYNDTINRRIIEFLNEHR
jgi:pimeloyl-ACP methyl ester carboxylesterase